MIFKRHYAKDVGTILRTPEDGHDSAFGHECVPDENIIVRVFDLVGSSLANVG